MKFQSGPEQLSSRNLLQAVLISLLLHAIILWQPPSAISGAALPSQALPPGASLKATLPALPVLQPLTSDLPAKLAAKSRDIPQITKPPAAPLRTDASVASASAATPPRLVPDSAETGIDANGLRQYRVSLATAARRYRVYPAQAMENGWSGTAEIALAIAADGVALPVQLRTSSGHAVLDAAALEMIANAAANTVVPISLRGQSFSIALPVVFDQGER